MAIAATAVLAFTSISRAALYTDTTGDEFTGNPHMDITSCEVTNDFSHVIFKINLAGNPVAVNWGKYCIGIDTNSATGDFGPTGNGWSRKISMPTIGMDYWVGSWVDGGGGASYLAYDGVSWGNVAGGASLSSITTSNLTIKVPIASLAKTYGDSFNFDVYTTGSNQDPAIDSLANPAQSVGNWGDFYASDLTKTYTLVVPPIPATNAVKFTVNMEVPIWEYNNSVSDGFNTNTDSVYVRGSFNGWGTVDPATYQLFQVGTSSLYTNTVKVVQYLNQTVDYKFEGVSFPGYENPVLSCGGNRTLLITSQNMSAPTNYFGDRKLSYPTNYVTLNVDMSFVRNFGQFDPTLGHGVTLPGNFNGWNSATNGNGAIVLTPGINPNTNIYSATFSYPHSPTNSCANFYKFYISGNGAVRDGGWENPISSNGGNRTFSVGSVAQTNSYYYNDETANFSLLSVQKLDVDSAKVTWQSFPSRGGISIGGVYQIESRSSLNSGNWTTNDAVNSTTSSTSYTNTGLTGTGQQFYRVSLKSLVP